MLNVPLVSFHKMPLNILEVAAEVILQGADHTAVFIHQLGGSWLRAQPVNQREQLILLHLLITACVM